MLFPLPRETGSSVRPRNTAHVVGELQELRVCGVDSFATLAPAPLGFLTSSGKHSCPSLAGFTGCSVGRNWDEGRQHQEVIGHLGGR